VGRAAIGHVATPPAAADDRSYAQPFERHHLIKSTSGSASPSTGSWPTTRNCAISFWPTKTITSPARPTPRSSCTRSARRASGDNHPPLIDVMRASWPAFRRGLQPGLSQRAGRHARRSRPAGHQAAQLRPGRAAVRRGQRERGPGEPGFRPRASKSLPPGRRSRSPNGNPDPPVCPQHPPAHCFFEWIYFSNVASTLDGRSVYMTRKSLGEELAQKGRRLRSTRHDRRSRSRHQQGGGRRDGLQAGRALRRRADPQPLQRPHLHRGRAAMREGPDQVHAAARSARRQEACCWSRTRSSAPRRCGC
jgi:amidophosphoribosyltransferase